MFISLRKKARNASAVLMLIPAAKKMSLPVTVTVPVIHQIINKYKNSNLATICKEVMS